MTTLSSPVSIHVTPRKPTEAHITQHRRIRLDALLTNPESFLATYEHESKLDCTKWRERLEQEGVWTFFATSDDVYENLGDTHVPSKPWIATLTLLSPSFLARFLNSNLPIPIFTSTWPLSLLGSGTDLWLIVGLWVRPEWRRNGVAQKIIKKAVHFVVSRSHRDGATTLEAPVPDAYQPLLGSSNSRATVLLEVFVHNKAALECYQSVGFEILDPEQFYESPETTPSRDQAQAENKSTVGGKFELKTHWMGKTIHPPPPPHRSNM